MWPPKSHTFECSGSLQALELPQGDAVGHQGEALFEKIRGVGVGFEVSKAHASPVFLCGSEYSFSAISLAPSGMLPW